MIVPKLKEAADTLRGKQIITAFEFKVKIVECNTTQA